MRMKIMNLNINHPQAAGSGWDFGNEASKAPDFRSDKKQEKVYISANGCWICAIKVNA